MALPGSDAKHGVTLGVDNRKTDPERSLLIHGFSSTPTQTAKGSHALEQLEKTYDARNDAMNMAMLKKMQGIQAPLKLMMERQAASQVGRLPFLPSSNLMRDVLEARDEDIGFDSILGNREEPEVMGPPHLVVERSLNIL